MTRSRILVWDLPTRLFHWLLAASFAGAWITAESEKTRDLHVLLGYTFAGLILFRLVWGVVGTRYARFASFAAGPGRVLAYLRSLFGAAPQRHVGHNPAGGWAIFALLGLGVATAATGYAAFNEIGPRWMEDAHEAAAAAMLALVGLHVFAVLASSLLHRENLVAAMLSGRKSGSPDEAIRRPRLLAGTALAAAVLAFWVAALQGSLPESLGTGPAAARPHHAEHHAARHADD